jgi:fibronectin-binding autotransporter adhesin
MKSLHPPPRAFFAFISVALLLAGFPEIVSAQSNTIYTVGGVGYGKGGKPKPKPTPTPTPAPNPDPNYTRTATNTSGTADQWSAGTNWDTTPTSGTTTQLVFGGAVPASLAAGVNIFTNNDIAGNFQLNILNFTYAGPASGIAPTVTISGSPLEFVSNGATTPTMSIAATGTVKPLLTISNNIVLTNNLSITGTTNGTLSGIISGASSLTKDGVGTLTLSNGSNSWTGGLVIKQGIVSMSASGNLGGTSNGITLDGGTLQVLNTLSTGASRTISVTSNGGTFDASASGGGGTTVNSIITNGTGATSSTILNKTGSFGLTLTGSNSGFTGQWNVTSGTLAVGAAQSISSSNAVTLSLTGQFRLAAGITATIGNLNGSGTGTATIQTNSGATTGTLVVTQSVDGSVSNVIANGSGILALTKSGGAVLTLSGTNTYTGATTVNAGTLLVNGASGSLASGSAVSVNNAGTVLGGAGGTINGTVSVGTGAILEGGTGSTGQTLNLKGAVTMSSGSIIQLALGASGTHSTIAIGSPGTLVFATNQDFKFIDLGATAGSYAGLITGVPDPGTALNSWVIDNAGYTGSFSWDIANGGEIDLTLTAVPEPSTWIGGGLALLAVGYSQRRRFKKLAAWS